MPVEAQQPSDYIGILQYFEENCVGKHGCEIDLRQPSIMGNVQESNDDNLCTDPNAQFFIQFTCEQDEFTQAKKYDIMCLATSLIMFIAFFYSRVILYLQDSMKISMLEQDANTITAGDFTVEMNISSAMW